MMMHNLVATDEVTNPLEVLTDKQRAVLDLLLHHKTSKEISRQLGISPHTVDQRILLARAKLNVATRAEVANEYRRLLSLYERSIYPSSHLAPSAFEGDSPSREDDGGRGVESVAPQPDWLALERKADRKQAPEETLSPRSPGDVRRPIWDPAAFWLHSLDCDGPDHGCPRGDEHVCATFLVG